MVEGAQDLHEECRSWLDRTRQRDERPVRVQLTPSAISSFRVQRRKGMQVLSAAGCRHLAGMSRLQAVALRKELAKSAANPKGTKIAVIRVALVALTIALDVDETNTDERVVELSDAALALIHKLVQLDLRSIGQHGGDHVVTCDTQTMTTLEAELRAAIFREGIEPRDQLVLLRAHRSVKLALGGQTE